MPFRLTIAFVIIMGLINRVFQFYLDKFVMEFIDDILVYSSNKDDHERYLRMVQQTMSDKQLYVKSSKCECWLGKVTCLVILCLKRDGIDKRLRICN